MKAKKQWFLVFMVMVLILLSACGSGNQSGSAGADSGSGSSSGQQANVSDAGSSGSSSGGSAGSEAPKELQKLSVKVGRQPFAGGNSPITQYMIDNKLFEKYAAELGYDLTVTWNDYPTAIPMVSEMVSNQLDFGMWGATPIIRVIAEKQPISVLSLGEGRLEFPLITREGSGIRNLEDLRGKTVGVLIGGDPQFIFNLMLEYSLGSPNPDDFNITLVNTPTQAAGASLPKGMDASVVNLTAYLKARSEDPTIVPIVSSYGITGSHYDGPAGQGAGHLMPGADKSPFYPEGYYLHRSFWVVRDEIVEKHPKVAQAFVMAEQAAVDELSKLSKEEIAALAHEYWDMNIEAELEIVEKELLFQRNWVWTTQGDANALVTVSKNLAEVKAIESALTWEDVMANMKKTSGILHEAYKAMGERPASGEFTKKEGVKDYRGLPVWEMDDWEIK